VVALQLAFLDNAGGRHRDGRAAISVADMSRLALGDPAMLPRANE